MHWVLDSVSDQICDVLRVYISLDSEKHLLVGILDTWHYLVKISVPLFNHFFSILFDLHEPLLLLWRRRHLAYIDHIPGLSVDPPMSESVYACLLGLLEHAYQRWLDL
jgi:hypothetical protein